MTERIALIGVDIQNAFGSNGEIAVPGAETVVAPMNRAIEVARSRNEQVYLTGDWHDKNSKHFKVNGGIWDIHAVAGSDSAKFLYGLDTAGSVIVHKGLDVNNPDGYTPWEDSLTDQDLTFAEQIKKDGITTLVGGGLIYNVCVKLTLIGAANRHLKTYILTDAAPKLNLPKENSTLASRRQME